MDYKSKYLKYKNKYLNLKNQIGGAFILPEQLREIVSVTDDGNLDITNSLEQYLARWKGDTPNNIARKNFLINYVFQNISKDIDLNFINPKGNGGCFYIAMHIFLKLTKTNDVYKHNNYMELFNDILQRIRLIGIVDPMFEDPNSPEIEFPMFIISEIYNVQITYLDIRDRDKIKKYTNNNVTDSIILLNSEGHINLIFPTEKNGSSNPEIRMICSMTIPE